MICVPLLALFGVVALLSLPNHPPPRVTLRDSGPGTANEPPGTPERQSGSTDSQITTATGSAFGASGSAAQAETSSDLAHRTAHGATPLSQNAVRAAYASQTNSLIAYGSDPRSEIPYSGVRSGTLPVHNRSALNGTPYDGVQTRSVPDPATPSRRAIWNRLERLERKLRDLEDAKDHQDIARLDRQFRLMEQHVRQLAERPISDGPTPARARYSRSIALPATGDAWELARRIDQLQEQIDQLAARGAVGSEFQTPANADRTPGDRRQKQLVELEQRLLQLEADAAVVGKLPRQSYQTTDRSADVSEGGPAVPPPSDHPVAIPSDSDHSTE